MGIERAAGVELQVAGRHIVGMDAFDRRDPATLGLGYLGSKPAEGWYVVFSRILTAYYFLHFLVILPLLGLLESPKPLPSSISDDVLAKKHPAAVPAE